MRLQEDLLQGWSYVLSTVIYLEVISMKFDVFIEIPMGSSVKYEFRKEKKLLYVDRFSFTSMYYPFNYGFIPDSQGEDNDPLDVLVLSSFPVYPGAVVEARSVALLRMEDEEGIDSKIIAVPVEKVDPFYSHIQDINHIPPATKDKIRHFFEHYKELEPGKWVKIKDWQGRKQAEAEIRKALK